MKIPILPSQQITAAGFGGWIPKKNANMLAVTVKITAGSGTVTDFTLWLEGSPDGSSDSSGDDMVADHALQDVDAAAGGTVRTNVRDIIDGKSTINAERFWALYKHLPSDYVRARWTIAGTSPNLTVSVDASGM